MSVKKCPHVLKCHRIGQISCTIPTIKPNSFISCQTAWLQICQSSTNNFFVTSDANVRCTHTDTVCSTFDRCSHEEADTRMMLHVANAVESSFSRVTIRTVDSDVVVIAVAISHRLAVEELWVAFGTGTDFRYLPVHLLAASTYESWQKSLLGTAFFHAFIACDTVSSFTGRGKKLLGTRGTLFQM